MKYGCIGEKLAHSFSKEIHALIADYDYILKELGRDEVDSFMKAKQFTAINVTIPYKETVIPYLSYIDDGAALIGAVNTIVNRDGKLYGYNTDFFGMSALAKHAGIDLCGKKVLILGTGGTSKTAFAVATSAGAREIIKASRRSGDDAVLYTDVYNFHADAEVIINTTPVGMFPNAFEKPIDISKFPKLIGVLDAIYNPNKTPLILDAMERGIAAEGGLYMLVAQGVRASEIFLGTTYEEDMLERVFRRILNDKTNIVLTGMPSSGKTTVGKILSKQLGRELIDTDRLIVENEGVDIPTIFKTKGEEYFRNAEALAIRQASVSSGIIIATGGGAILREENVRALRENGRLFFIDRPLSSLLPTKDRPTASSVDEIRKRYEERYGIYTYTSDTRIDADCSAQEVADRILEAFDRI